MKQMPWFEGYQHTKKKDAVKTLKSLKGLGKGYKVVTEIGDTTFGKPKYKKLYSIRRKERYSIKIRK